MIRAVVQVEGGAVMTLGYEGDVAFGEHLNTFPDPVLFNLLGSASAPGNQNTIDRELDEFVEYVIYRDDVEVGRTSEMTYVDQLPGESGTYTYQIAADFHEGISEMTEPVDIVYEFDFVTGEITGVPSAWAITRTYPNPFNPTVHIVLAVPRAAQVEATIVNVLGQQVATLHNDQLKAGFNTLTWSAQNHPSGLYFLQVNSSDGFRSAKKLMFIK
jgi:hypothetical protein